MSQCKPIYKHSHAAGMGCVLVDVLEHISNPISMLAGWTCGYLCVQYEVDMFLPSRLYIHT